MSCIDWLEPQNVALGTTGVGVPKANFGYKVYRGFLDFGILQEF